MSSRTNGSREESFNFEQRLNAILLLALAILVLLSIRFYFLQVSRHQDFLQRAENNRIREIPILAPRGAILDRNGRLIVDNSEAFNVVLAPDLVTSLEQTIDALVRVFGADREQILADINDHRRAKTQPILIKQNAGEADRAWVVAHSYDYPEISIERQPQRRYPYGKLAAHVIGYIGEISPKQLEDPHYADYKPGDIIGKAGLESVYDKQLRGKNGMKRLIVDSRGRAIDTLEEIPPVKGRDLVTAIDLDLQQVAEEQFDITGEDGVAIAMNPQNGEILAMVSRPSFDPNIFAENVIAAGERKAEIRALMIDPKHPLYNNAIQGRYPTGSTWKLLMAAAALEEGVITPEDSRIPCGGGIQMGNRFVRCMGNHGAPDIHVAIVRSCDGYFYRLGLKLGVDLMHKWAVNFGAGARTEIDLTNEVRGWIPDRELKRKLNPKNPEWKDFDTVLASIGQGIVAISPLQLLRATSGIVMGGEYQTPHVMKELRDPIEPYSDPPSNLKLSPKTVSIINYGAWGVCNEGGTAGGQFPRELNVGGKTGTAQVIAMEKARGKEHKDHAWFISFAPLHTEEKPEIGVVVLTPNGGFGGRASAPKAKMIHAAYFSKKLNRPVIPEMAGRFGLEGEKPALSASIQGSAAPPTAVRAASRQ
jgi:penicillin-binding protein 2